MVLTDFCPNPFTLTVGYSYLANKTNKGVDMYRFLLCSLICFFLSSSTVLGENPLTGLWPFSKSTSTPNFDRISKGTTARDTSLGLPSPSKIIGDAQKQTRKAFKNVQNVGKSLNPFAKKSSKQSWFSKILPKPAPKRNSPSTMGDFMKLKRPSF